MDQCGRTRAGGAAARVRRRGVPGRVHAVEPAAGPGRRRSRPSCSTSRRGRRDPGARQRRVRRGHGDWDGDGMAGRYGYRRCAQARSTPTAASRRHPGPDLRRRVRDLRRGRGAGRQRGTGHDVRAERHGARQLGGGGARGPRGAGDLPRPQRHRVRQLRCDRPPRRAGADPDVRHRRARVQPVRRIASSTLRSTASPPTATARSASR